MLELILGKDWTANTDTILTLVARDVAEEKPGRILLVPELISHDMERRLCAASGDTASRFAEVLSFTRLARRVADSVGAAAMQCLDNGGRLVAMAAAAKNLHSRLKVYAAVETKPEFLADMINAVDEFKRCCITAEDLKAASLQSEGAFAQKLEELALLLESYDALCHRGKRDPRDQMSWVLEQLEDSSFAETHTFYIDGFPDFTRQHMAILEHLIRSSPYVAVSLNCDRVNSEVMAYEKAGATALQLQRCAQQLGVPVKITVVPEKPSPLLPVREKLFQGKIPAGSVPGEVLRLTTAPSVYQSCCQAAEDVLAMVRSGSRYRDIGVVCADLPGYAPVLGLVFRRYRIPVYLSGTDDILQKGPVVTVLSALEAVLGGFEQRVMQRYLRSVLSPLDPDTCDLVENYTAVWAISGNRWKEPWQYHPEGLSGNWDPQAQERLAVLEQARQTVMEPLLRLRQIFKDEVSLAPQVRGLYTFLEEIRFPQRLEQLAKELDEAGDNRSSQVMNQLWEILVGAMEQLYDVLGDTVWDSEAFLRLFSLLLSQYDVGTIPTVLDAVTVGPVSAMRCQRQQHLILLGAEEGKLPGYGGSAGILTDQERVALRQMGVPLTGGAMEGIQAEFSEIYGVVCGAACSLWVHSASAQPSYVFRRLQELSAGGVRRANPVGFGVADAYEAGAYLAQWDAETAANALGVADAYKTVCRQRSHRLGKLEKPRIHSLYGKSLLLSASQVDRQAECRLSYFLKYGLRLRERKEAAVDPAEFGTYVHAVLENTAGDVMKLGGFHQVSLEQTMQIAHQHSEAYAKQHFSQLDSLRIRYLFQRNAQELDMVVQELWEELSQAGFVPVEFELSFGGDGKMPAIEIPSEQMEAKLRGFVDRVDVYGSGQIHYFRVVDYKTGKKDFDYCDVFNGVGLQMLLYLFALEKAGEGIVGSKAVAAGVQYFPARAPYVSLDGAGEPEEGERQKLWKRRGLLLNDEITLAAMDPSEDMGRLCCTRKRDGSLSGDLADRAQLRLLRQHVFRTLAGMVDEIASGCVDPNPYTRGSSHSACAFCPYGAVCKGEREDGRRNYKTMTAQRFWDELVKEAQTNG